MCLVVIHARRNPATNAGIPILISTIKTGEEVFCHGPYYLTSLVNLLGPIVRVISCGRRRLLHRTIGNGSGWDSLSALNEADREAILEELFAPGIGADFNSCRMPIGANDLGANDFSAIVFVR